ncbi:DUF4238 domain-containing protein [Kitasatospora purpeofusca]|uniref:DUF4238 domain-containing protein n=1 Tax=Kitasatospora purpeofusca TaxID=67352 RepID=UPI0037F5BAA4
MAEHPKKHHFVPQFLLRRFAGPDEKLLIHRVAEDKQYQATVVNTGHRNLGHSLYRPGREPDHHSMEGWMSDLESEASAAVRELAQGRTRHVPADVRRALAWLMALQWQRSRFLLHVVGQEVTARADAWAAADPFAVDLGEDDATNDPAQEALLLQTALMSILDRHVLEPWRLRDEQDASPKDRWNHLVSIVLGSNMHWSCYRPTWGGLVTSDTTVCFSGITGTPPADIPVGFFDHGVGAGLHQFKRITMPLGSNLAVIISQDPRDADRLSAADINRFTVYNSREFVAHSSALPQSNPKLATALKEALAVQRMIAPAFLHGYGPGARRTP